MIIFFDVTSCDVSETRKPAHEIQYKSTIAP